MSSTHGVPSLRGNAGIASAIAKEEDKSLNRSWNSDFGNTSGRTRVVPRKFDRQQPITNLQKIRIQVYTGQAPMECSSLFAIDRSCCDDLWLRVLWTGTRWKKYEREAA